MLPDSFMLSDLYCGHEGKYICSLKGRFDPQLVNEPIQLMELSCGCWIVLDGNNRIGLILKRNMDAKIGEFPRKIFIFVKNEEFDEGEIHYWNPYPKSFGYVIPLSKQLNIVIRNKKSFKSETDYNNEVKRITSLLTNQMHECHPHTTKNGVGVNRCLTRRSSWALRGTKPPIWRRFHIRSDVTLFKLHQVLQTAMGWTNSHLHQFVVGDLYYGTPDPEFPRPRKNDKKVRLDEALKQPKDRLVYEYDFGDDWTHDVVLERVAEPEPAAKYPQVVAGKRACPPEDCGGIPGYYRLLEVLSREDHPEHDEMLEWVGGEFDPEVFDLNEANVAFHGGWREA